MDTRWILLLGVTVLLACGDDPQAGDDAATDTVALAPGAGPAATGTETADTRTGVAPLATGAAANARTRTASGGGSAPAGKGAVVIEVKEEAPGLLEQARTHPLDAQHIAQAKFPMGTIQAGWLERRGSGLAYRFRVVDEDGKTWDVIIDSFNGDIIFTSPVDTR